MGKDKSAKRNKKPDRLKDLPAKATRASEVRGGGKVDRKSIS